MKAVWFEIIVRLKALQISKVLFIKEKKSWSEINGKGRKKEKEGASGVLWIAFLERNCHFDDSTLPENKLRLQYSELIDIFILLQQ